MTHQPLPEEFVEFMLIVFLWAALMTTAFWWVIFAITARRDNRNPTKHEASK